MNHIFVEGLGVVSIEDDDPSEMGTSIINPPMKNREERNIETRTQMDPIINPINESSSPGILEKIGSTASDIGRGALMGVNDAVDNIYRTAGLQGFGDWLDKTFPGGVIDIKKPETIAGEVAAPLAQGAVSMIPAARALRAVGVSSPFLQWTMGGAFSDFAAFAPEDPSVANITQVLGKLPQPQLEAVRREIESWMAKNESDSTLVKRLKGAAEGAVIGGTLDGIIKFAKAGKKMLTTIGSGAAVSVLSGDDAEAGAASQILKELVKKGVKVAEPFYSKALRTVKESKTAKAPGKQWLGTLRNAGVKDEEITWLGLDSFLKEGGSISKSDLDDYIRTNQVEVREVTKGGDAGVTVQDTGSEVSARWAVVDAEGNELARYYEQNDAETAARSYSPTKFSGYTFPGGKNYRELLFTLPPRQTYDSAATKFREAGISLDVSYDSIDNPTYRLRKWGSGAPSKTNIIDPNTLSPNLKKVWDDLNTSPHDFTGGHFDEPNVFAHVRSNERVDAEGKKVLFLEEVQSDWHAEGRREGYTVLRSTSENDRLFFRDVANEIDRSETELANMLHEGISAEDLGLHPTVYQRVQEIQRDLIGASGVPDVPFKKTWHELVFRRMVRHAVENDFDRVAWTTGAQQSDRYNLSKIIDSLRVFRDADNSFTLEVRRVNTREYEEMTSGISKEEIPNYIGKDLAEKISKSNVGIGGQETYQGLDLKIDDKFMKDLYDKKIVQYAKKFGKKFGAKVGQMEIIANPSGIEFPIDMIDRSQTVHSLTITDKMRETALKEGFPLFSGIGVPIGAGAATELQTTE